MTRKFTTTIVIEHCTNSLCYNDELDLEDILRDFFGVEDEDDAAEFSVEYREEEE